MLPMMNVVADEILEFGFIFEVELGSYSIHNNKQIEIDSMDIEIITIERSSDEPHHYDKVNTILTTSHQQTARNKNSLKKSNSISNLFDVFPLLLNRIRRYISYMRWLCSRMEPSTICFCMFAIFTSIAMIVGILTIYFTSPESSGTCQLTFKRLMKSSLTSSSQPRSLIIADLNNDHQLDIAVVNSGTNTIAIFLSTGDGTFANQTTYSTGPQSHPYSIAVTDFNNDHYLDIAVANYGTNNIGIFLGNGNGTFVDQKLFSLGSSRPLYISIGDFNNDYRMDIVVANYGTNNVGLLLGYGNGSFQDQTTYSTGYDSIPYSLVVADFNKDNRLDLAVANYGTNKIGIFFGYGNGTFTNQMTYTTTPNSNPSSIAAGDFNNDTQLDIVVTNYGIGSLGIFLGQNNGTFAAQTTYSIGLNAYPQCITIGDFNKDSALDAAMVDSTNNRVYIFLGSGNGSFATLTTYDAISGSSPYWMAVTDFNNNNQSDAVIADYGTNNVLVLIDYSYKPSVRQTDYLIGQDSRTTSVVVSDFNNDSRLDIVGNNANDGNIVILIGLGNETFSKGTTYSVGTGSGPHYICVGDLNNDKQMDIVTANLDSDSVGVLLGHGDGTFAPVTTYSTGIGSTPWWVALGDLNNDNRLDIVSANPGSNTIGIHLGNGNGTFAAMATYSTVYGHAPYAVAIGDMNNDNYLDLVVADATGLVIIFLGYGNGSFIVWNATFTSVQNSVLFSISLADFNSDGNLDIVISDRINNNIIIFLGNGDGTLKSRITYSTGSGSSPYYVIVADFNNDNKNDIAATNTGSDEVVIFYGYGNGSFELSRTYSTGSGSKPYGITTADFNNDKQLEIVVTLWGNGNLAVLNEYHAAEFVNQTTYSTGSTPNPFSIAVSDFNNDNRSDVVVANSGTNSLGILLGSSNGTFRMEMTYSIGTDADPQYVITFDINKDNKQDIVSVNSKTNTISVIMGYGNGSFADQIIYSTGDDSYPFAAAADLNNDHRLDFFIVSQDTDSVGVFFGYNYTTFQNQTTYSSMGNSQPYDIVVSDFNNDNYLDIAIVFFGNDSLGILFGYGNGSFTIMVIYSTGNGSQPSALAVGDFNNDGRSDIVVANYATSTIDVLLGHGNGSFAAIMTHSTGNDSYPLAVAIGDVNNDDRLDLIVGNYGANSVGILLGYNNDTFSIVKTYSTGEGSSPRSVAVGDFNKDNRLDIVVANQNTDCVGVLPGFGDGSFGNQVNLSTGSYSYPLWVTVGDFNNDNRLDIATANYNGNNVGILLGYGNGTFADLMTYSTGAGSTPYCIEVGDFNYDNKLDIAVVNHGTKTIVVLFGFGDGSFVLGTAYSTGIESLPYALAIGDFNNDIQLDIAVIDQQSNNIGVFLGNGSQSYAALTTYSTGDGSQPHLFAIDDLNSDGWLDIVIANYGTDNVGVLLGRSNVVFDPIMTYSTGTGSAPYSVALADFNNDHHLDIVVTNSETDTIAIFLGHGNGTFKNGTTYSTGDRSRPYTVVISDFNNDNISDIAIANSGTSNIFLFYGYGNGTFGNETSYPFGYGYNPYSIAVTDLNGDGWMDIVIACYNTDHIETLVKTC